MKNKLNLKHMVDQINYHFPIKIKKDLNRQNLETKLKQIKNKLSTFQQKNKQDMEKIKIKAEELLIKTEQTNIMFENQADNQLRDLEYLTQNLSAQIENQIYLRKEKEHNIISVIEKKFNFMKSEIDRERALRENILGQISITVQKDVPSLMKLIVDGADSREEDQQKVTQLIKSELSNSKGILSQFKETQQNSQHKILELIRQLNLKVTKEVEYERRIREETHDQILFYVEERCNQLQNEKIPN